MAQEEKYLDAIEDIPASSPSPEPASEPAAEAKPEEHEPPEGQEPTRKPDTRPEGYVTKGERDRIASELQQERQQRALYEDRFNKVVERFFKQAEPEQAAVDDPKPDVREDPIGHMEWKDRQEAKAAADQKQRQDAWEKEQEEQRQFRDTLNRATARLERVVQTRPEVGQLYGDVRLAAAKAYSAQGVPDHQLKDMVDKYEADVIKWARQEYIPIEDALEQVAAKFGIQMPQAKPAEQRELPPRAENGQFTAEAEKAAKITQSQERNASLGSAPGAPVKKMTPAELAKMPEDEMWRHFESMKGQKGSKNFDRDMGFRS